MGKPLIIQMWLPFYQHFLFQQLGPDKAVFLQLLVRTLQSQKQLCLERLAEALPLPIMAESRRKALQRFLLLPCFSLWHLWLPLLAQIVEHAACHPQRLVLAIDRTNWWKYNLLMVSLVWDRRALPVFWRLLNHEGNSSLPERRSVLLPVLKYFHDKQVIVLGDREFGSVGFADWLQSQDVSYCLRLKRSEWLQPSAQSDWQCLADLVLKPGQSLWFQGAKLVKRKQFGPVNIAGKRGFQPGRKQPYYEPWWLLTNLPTPKDAIAWYRCRWSIEEMFRDCKSGGYNLEKLRVQPKRFKAMLIVLAMGMSLSVMVGKQLKRQGLQKYVARLGESGRVVKRRSTFRVGLQSEVWSQKLEDCRSLVEKLIALRRRWARQYRQGQRALVLLQLTS